MKNSKKAFHEQVAENLIEQLKQGTAPWQKPWQPGDPITGLPHNATSGNRYRGINTLQLMSQPYTDTRWMTYKQATALGAQVNKGEKGTLIQYWKFNDERIKKEDQGMVLVPVMATMSTAMVAAIACTAADASIAKGDHEILTEVDALVL